MRLFTVPKFHLNHTNTEYIYCFFFLVRTSYIKCLAARNLAGASSRLSTASKFALSAVTGILAQIFTIPVAIFATRQQLGAPKGKGRAGEEHDDSLYGVARE